MGVKKYLAFIPLALQSIPKVGDKVVTFRTVPKISKIEIRRYLKAVYGMEVEKVHTANVAVGLYPFRIK